MGFPEGTYLGNRLEDWFGLVVFAVIGTGILLLARRLLVRRFGEYARKTETLLDDLIVELIAQTRSYTLAAIALYLGVSILGLASTTRSVIEKAAIIFVLIQGIIWGYRIIDYWLRRTVGHGGAGANDGAGTATAISFFAKLVLWSSTLLLALDNLGFNVTTLVAGLGIGGIAVALAAQNILADLFASLSIILDKPFELGDFIVASDFLGSIEHVGIKTTRIRSLSGEQIVFSNAELLKCRIRNFKRMAERRIVFTIGVTYDTPIEKLQSVNTIIRSAIASQEHTRLDRVHFKEYGDSALIFETVYFVLDPDFNTYMDIQQAINFAILAAFRKQEIDFAFPTMTIVKGNAVPENGNTQRRSTASLS